ncbi:hypothetical protein ACVWZA_002357 [Sphingomonas sp. UYAg733]
MSVSFESTAEARSPAPSTLAAMKETERWLIWQSITRPGKSKPDKVPFYIDGKPRGVTDAPDDLARLTSYSAAREAVVARGNGWGLGFALGRDASDRFWQGVDLDHIDENGLLDLPDTLPGYVETSPSGKGVHAICYGRQFRSFGSNGGGVEAYSGGRFFTFTGNAIRDQAITCAAEYVEHVLAPRHKVSALKASPAIKVAAVTEVSAQTVNDLRSALNHMPSDDYALWIELGHALKPLGDTGRGLWLDWSAGSPKFDRQEAARKWDGFDPQRTGYRAVFARAQERQWINPASNAAIFGKFADDESHVDLPSIAAVPFTAPEFFDIPPRSWVLGHWLLRRVVTTLIAPGGTGKSALMVGASISLATGRELLGKTVWAGPKRVWLWNLEDDRDELTRQLVACSLHHRISECDYEGRLFVNDARTPLCIATKGRDGLTVHTPVADAVAAEIRAKGIDVLIIDPFVSSHRAEENDNGQVDVIAKLWGSIALETDCSIVLVHHSRKLGGQQADAESARGASALGNAARSVLVVNRMEKAEAIRFGIAEDDRRSYIRVSNDKANRAPVGKEDWYRLVSVKLANGGPEGGDSVVVVENWSPPDASAAVSAFDEASRTRVQSSIAAGDWREHVSAKNWVGRAIAEIVGAEIEKPADKHRVKALLSDMLSKGQLKIERRPDASRHLRDFIVVGEPIDSDRDTPAW